MSNDHLGGDHPTGDGNTWMPDIWGYLVVKYGIKIVLDIGCGYGHACKWFADLGLNVVGIEGSQEYIDNTVCKNVPSSVSMVCHDFSKGPYSHGIPFDLAWSAEFLEHIEEEYLPNVEPCFKAAKYVALTHGEPGQHGRHHVNCQSDFYWVKVFNHWGFFLREDETALLRSTDRFRAPWGRRSLMMFERI